MLGRLRRTTRTDVGLALTMAGFVYLAWVLACYTAKLSAHELHIYTRHGHALPRLPATALAVFGHWPAILFDLLGPVVLCLALWLVIRASRQRRIISWSWLVITCQAIGAILIASWAALASAGTHSVLVDYSDRPEPNWSPVVVAIAVLIWVSTLVWLIFERIKLTRGPGMRDVTRTHMFRR